MTAPGILHEEAATTGGPIAGEESTVVGFLGKAEMGPISTPTKCQSMSDFLFTFGGPLSDSDLYYAVKGFFDNGGQTCYVNRLAHYTTGTHPGVAASLVVNDPQADQIATIAAKSEGLFGNSIQVETTANPSTSTTLTAAASQGDATIEVASTQGIYAGQVLKLVGGGNTEYVKVQSFSTSVATGSPVHTVTLTNTVRTVAGMPITTTTVTSLEFDLNVYFEASVDPVETFTSLNLESANARFIETIVNDESIGSRYITATADTTNTLLVLGFTDTVNTTTYYPAAITKVYLTSGASEGTIVAADIIGDALYSTGFQAFNAIDDIRLLAAIPDDDQAAYTAAVVHGGINYCATRTDCFFMAAVDRNSSAATAITEKAAAGYNVAYGALFFNRVKVLDPDGVGLATTRYVDPLGHVCGRFVATDRKVGPYRMAAGVEYGKLVGTLGVETDVGTTAMGNLNDAGINVIKNFGVGGNLIFGCRTVNPLDPTFKYINVRRTLIYIEASVAKSLRWTVFANNTSVLWTKIKYSLDNFLNGLWQQNALKGSTAAQAFVIKVGETDGVQTANDTANGRLIADIGLAFVKPAEFIIFRWSEQQ